MYYSKSNKDIIHIKIIFTVTIKYHIIQMKIINVFYKEI